MLFGSLCSPVHILGTSTMSSSKELSSSAATAPEMIAHPLTYWGECGIYLKFISASKVYYLTLVVSRSDAMTSCYQTLLLLHTCFHLNVTALHFRRVAGCS